MGGRWWVLPLAAAMFALVSGCSGGAGDGNGVASLSDGNKPAGEAPANDGGTDEDKFRAYTKCMRDHGIEMSDPDTSGSSGGGVSIELGSEDGEKMQKADEECKPLLPNGGKPQPLDPQQLDKLREHAKCLREHGLDVPDPNPNDPGLTIGSGEDDPEKVNKAFEACSNLLPDGPGGPGGPAAKVEVGEPPK
jgi:hypothetical protein